MTQEFSVKISTIPSSLKVKTISQSVNPSSLFQTLKATLLTADPNQLIGQFSSSVYRSVKYLIQYSYGSEYHTSEILLLHDGTDVYVTEYASIFTSESLGEFNAALDSGYIKIYISPTYADTNVTLKGILVPI